MSDSKKDGPGAGVMAIGSVALAVSLGMIAGFFIDLLSTPEEMNNEKHVEPKNAASDVVRSA